MKSAVDYLNEQIRLNSKFKENSKGGISFTIGLSKIDELYKQAKEIEEQQNKQVICKDCDKPISVDDINNHLFMNIKGGGLIHWNCADK